MNYPFRRLFSFVALLPIASLVISPSLAFASSATWTDQTTGTTASGQQWYSITSSSDGTKLAAVAWNGDIWTSTDSGATWTDETPSGSAHHKEWAVITSSADGTKLAAAVDGGDIWTSSDSGATWTNQTTGTSLSGLAWGDCGGFPLTSSSDGTKLAAAACTVNIYTSTDSGTTWATSTAPVEYWSSITSSSDGTKLAAVASGGDIWTSTDGGATWTNDTTGTGLSGLNWSDITSSSDGTKLAAVVNGGDIWTSTDSGATWTDETASTSASELNWQSITSSADGTKLAAVETTNGDIYTSADSGTTWATSTAPVEYWRSITSSADGTKLAAVETTNGDIWTASLVFTPSVTTSAASSISATSATLGGSITDTEGENPETRGFAYGPTTAYGATTTDSGSFSTGTFTASISSLTCNTAYHFAAYATNSAGTGYGSDQSFTTSVCPTPAPTSSGGGGGGIVASGPSAPSAAGILGTHAIVPPSAQAPMTAAQPTSMVSTTAGTAQLAAAPATTLPAQAATPSLSLSLDRELWDRGEDIRALQEFLNAHGFTVAATGPGSPGNETAFFGLHTYAALAKFQAENGLPATGYLGPLTRALISHLQS